MYEECRMWFGTEAYAQWIEPPLSGAESSAESYNSGGVDLNGYGWVDASVGGSRVYQYAWPASSSRASAQLMKDYSDGLFGRGKIYFHEPTTYDTNVLPAHWASPQLTCGLEAPQLVPGVDPTLVVDGTPGAWPSSPASYASFNLSIPAAPLTASGGNWSLNPSAHPLTDENSVFIPIPEGMTLHLGALTLGNIGSGGIFATRINAGGEQMWITYEVTKGSTALFTRAIPHTTGSTGVRLWIGKSSSGVAALAIRAMHGRLAKTGFAVGGEQAWYGGQGNCGVRFVGKPTYVTHNGIHGGQIEYAATFREVID